MREIASHDTKIVGAARKDDMILCTEIASHDTKIVGTARKDSYFYAKTDILSLRQGELSSAQERDDLG